MAKQSRSARHRGDRARAIRQSSIPDLLPGTLDLLILRTLQTEPRRGWAISERIQQISEDVLQICDRGTDL
jgi:hypothetical protein